MVKDKKNRRKRKRRQAVDVKKSKQIDRIMNLKVKHNMSDAEMEDIVRTTCESEEEADEILRIVRKQFRAGYCAIRLHGCEGCEDYFWLYKENHDCPICGNSAGRYKTGGEPTQEVFYFPVMTRLEQMYKSEDWRHAIRYPERRPKRYARSDVFDGSVYKKLRRDAGKCDDFLAIGYCADGIPADKRISRTILPGIASILNYDPRIRQKECNMLLTMLMPPKLPTKSAHKFYSILEDELHQLYYKGIAGGKLKGALVMLRADQKGKEFDLGLRNCTSYDAPCSVCEMLGDPGYGPFKTVRVGNWRRFLPATHRYRRDDSFGAHELRAPPPYRTKKNSIEGVEISEHPHTPLSYYNGYQSLPLLSGLPYYQPFVQSGSDLSHNLANFFKEVFAQIHPKEGEVSKWRSEADSSGKFTEIGKNAEQHLDPEVARTLAHLDVEDMRVTELEEFAKIIGVQHTGNKRELQDRIRQVFQTFAATGTAVVSVGKGRIPWVFTKDQIRLVDERFKGIVLPHNCSAFCTTKAGLFKSRTSCWRMVSKMQVFFMLPVLFLDTIEQLRLSLEKLVHGLTLLVGRVLSERRRHDKGYLTCFRHISVRDKNQAGTFITEAMSEYEKMSPPSSQKSHMHQFVHYPRSVDHLGSLGGTWMFGDERRNKVIKNMATQRKHCEASIARVYSERVRTENVIVNPKPVSLETCCIHNRCSKSYADTDPQLSEQLKKIFDEKYSVHMDPNLWMVHTRASIGGVMFTAGEDIHGVKRHSKEKMLRCGSVITVVAGNRSLYAWVERFLSFDSIHVAHVKWLPVPDYPTGSPVVVRLKRGGVKPNMKFIVELVDIDPSSISLLHVDSGIYVMRMKGIDTMPV